MDTNNQAAETTAQELICPPEVVEQLNNQFQPFPFQDENGNQHWAILITPPVSFFVAKQKDGGTLKITPLAKIDGETADLVPMILEQEPKRSIVEPGSFRIKEPKR